MSLWLEQKVGGSKEAVKVSTHLTVRHQREWNWEEKMRKENLKENKDVKIIVGKRLMFLTGSICWSGTSFGALQCTFCRAKDIERKAKVSMTALLDNQFWTQSELLSERRRQKVDERCSRIWPVTIEAVGSVSVKRRIRAGRNIVPHVFRWCFFW